MNNRGTVLSAKSSLVYAGLDFVYRALTESSATVPLDEAGNHNPPVRPSTAAPLSVNWSSRETLLYIQEIFDLHYENNMYPK